MGTNLFGLAQNKKWFATKYNQIILYQGMYLLENTPW